MSIALSLLTEVRWRGAVVVGDRPRALLTALAANSGRPIADERLIELIWGDDEPANATKSLQVLVSRTRTACGADAIVRDGAGYRLGVSPGEVDVLRLAAAVREAAGVLDRDAARAESLTRDAIGLADGLPASVADDGTVLSTLRRAAAADLATARTVLARATGRSGRHADALPQLETAYEQDPHDESLLTDLLQSEAAVRGPAAALERYDAYRQRLRDRLGSSPGEPLQRLHRELLARDRPVRSGVRYDATSLVGRDEDIHRLRSLLEGARVVSIVGPGGLGKTRLAHVLARDAQQPVVHVVELVGVASADDVVGEVGSVLGVRDSISSRRTLSPQQRADVRARIAQQLGQAPSLLVLDNCEHLIGAVADLVAFLVSTTAELRVLTTSRAPLAIAAEQVYLLGQLGTADAERLFCERAVAARPGVQLDKTFVRGIAERLEGLPLAIELAAAKVRIMAVEEIDRRLENRFALLRGGDRSAPDRHQTLLAVIDWSWNLLDEAERRALRRLALFQDGFRLDAAEAVLGPQALESVQGLIDQSLLSVRDAAGGVRYRMLETVREFGLMQLIDAGEDGEARELRRRWAIGYARRHGERLLSADQFTAIDSVGMEEINLADELRRAIAQPDVATAVQLLATLGVFWAIRGEHGRLIGMAPTVAETICGWEPPAELAEPTRVAVSIILLNAMFIDDLQSGPLRRLLERLGPGEGPRLAGMVRFILACDPDDENLVDRLEHLSAEPDQHLAWLARQWLSHVRENSGDLHGAIVAAESALELSTGESPWVQAILRTQLAQLTTNLGDRHRAAEYARAALPVMQRLGATDDELQLRSLLALCAIADGRLDEAERDLRTLDAFEVGEAFGGISSRQVVRTELALARGDVAAGLAGYRECVVRMRAMQFPGMRPTGVEPWILFGESTALTAHALFASEPEDLEYGWRIYRTCRDHGVQILTEAGPQLDIPVAGMLLFGLGAWTLLREMVPAQDAVRLLVLADRFGYGRTNPIMQWSRVAGPAERRDPGRLAALRGQYRERQPRELLEETRRHLERLPLTDAACRS